MKEIIEYMFANYEMKNGEIRKKGTRTGLTNETVIKQLGNYADDSDKDWSKADRTAAIDAWKIKLEEYKNQPSTDIIKEFIVYVCELKNLQFKKDTWYKQGVMLSESSVRNLFEAETFDWNRNNTDRKISILELNSKLNAYEIEAANDQAVETFNRIKFDSSNKQILREWLKLIHNSFKIIEKFEIFEMLFSHWMWQVKRRAKGLQTRDELFVNFFGKGGTGKTFLIKGITNPFKDFRVLNATINSIMDDRRMPELENNFIHFCDELASSDSKNVFMDKDLSVLKTIITSNDCLVYRPLGTNTSREIRPRTSIIAAANFHIYDVIMDSSGMRRFFEFNIGLDRNGYDTEITKKILSMTNQAWSGIDDSLEEGYWDLCSPINQEIMDIQDTYVRKDAFDLWIESVEIKKGGITRVQDLYESYIMFSESESLGHKKISVQSFSNKFSSLGYDGFLSNGRKKFKVTFTNKPEPSVIKTSKESDEIICGINKNNNKNFKDNSKLKEID